MKKYIYPIMACLIVLTSCTSEGKQMRKNLRDGNKDYKKEDFVDAEIDYRKALDEDIRSTDASYNLGNALCRQDKGEDALKQYKVTIDNTDDKELKAKAHHNIGNMCMNNEDYQNAVASYRDALRNNPKDDETRHNLAIAQLLLQNQEEEQEDQDDKQDEQQEEQEQQQDEQQQEEQEQEEQQQEEQQQNSSDMSRDQAEQILDALMQDERDTQEKVQMQEQRKSDQRDIDKNW